MKNILSLSIVSLLILTILGCSTKSPKEETLFTAPRQAWVHENAYQKIAFTLTSEGYKNYLFDYEHDFVVSVEFGFHTNENILYTHHELFDPEGNYLGIWGDPLYIAQNPDKPVNFYEYEISGNQLTLTKPHYGYLTKEMGEFFGDVDYVFEKKPFSVPPLTENSKFNNHINLEFYNDGEQRNTALFSFLIINEGDVICNIYDLKGQRVRRLIDSTMVPGQHQILWNGRDDNGDDLPAGLYFLLLKYNDVISFRGVVVII